MIALVHKPGAPLSGFIDCLWYQHGAAAPHPRERALPTGTTELVINLRDDRFRLFANDADHHGWQFQESVVCGPHSGYFVLDTAQPSTVIGVHFRPGGAAPFLAVPQDELMDRHVELEDLWGAEAHRLRQRLLAAASPSAMFTLLEDALRRRLYRPLLPKPAVIYAMGQFDAAPSIARIATIQADTGYCSRHFIELFKQSVGLTPKVYCRVQRFQSVIDRLARGCRVEWAHVAADCGYYDQPHLNREFRVFSGVTPGEYRPVAPERPNHTAVQAD